MKKKLFKIPVGKTGLTSRFVNVQAVNRKSAEQQVRRKHLTGKEKVLRG